MLLLVSVRDAVEATAAVAGGADILDAKEPSDGALAPVASETLLDMARAIPAAVSLSVALGEGSSRELLGAVRSVPLLPRRTTWFKFALVGPPDPADVPRVRTAVDELATRPDAPGLVLARYADDGLDAFRSHVRLASSGGVSGVLLDTRDKTRGSLLSRVAESDLAALRQMAGEHGLWLALAGSLDASDFPAMARIGARVIGVRGAACAAGRNGQLSIERVLALRAAAALTPAQPIARV